MLRRLRELLFPRPPAGPAPTRAGAAVPAAPASIRPRVLLVVHDPPVPEEGGLRLTEIFHWQDPDELVAQYIADLEYASHGYLRYQVVERIQADSFPLKRDGFRYTGADYVSRWRARRMHEPDALDHPARLEEFDLIGRYERGEIDEAWFFTFPYSGDFESTMVGRDAFWCNSPPVDGTQHCRGRFVVMGFNYERDVGCMLENFGHRVESVMRQVFRHHPPEQDLFARFTRYDETHPSGSHCGNVHFAPNSLRDYDWGNRRPVWSACDDWLDFPDLAGRRRLVDARDWGDGDMRQHHLWWLRRLPHVEGETFGVANNWWQYVVDPNRVR